MPRTSETYQLQIALQDIKPLIWRRVLVPSTTTFAKLHKVIQIAMGWEDTHEHRYVSNSAGPMKKAHERILTLKDMAKKGPGSCFFYEYDPGDNWVHFVVLEKVIDLRPLPSFFDCIAGAGACPPEDCGGAGGYAELLKILGDPSHPEHEERREWAGPRFAPGAFELEAVRTKLKKLNL